MNHDWLARAADFSYRRRRLVVVGWLVAALVGGFFALDLPKRIVPGGEPSPAAGSSKVFEAARDAGAPALWVAVTGRIGPPSDADLSTVADRVARTEDVTRVVPLAAPPRPGSTTRVLTVTVDGSRDRAMHVADDLRKHLPVLGTANASVTIGGFDAYRNEITILSFRDLSRAERIGLPIILVVLLLTFGTIWGAVLPLMIALVSLIVGLGIVDGLAHYFSMSEYVTNSASMLGVALGVDYAMFVVQRVREEARDVPDLAYAVRRAMSTTGHAVVWSGVTVLLAESTLFLVDSRAIRSVATGLVLISFLAIASTVVLLPAAIGMLGDRVLRRPRWVHDERRGDRSGWARWAAFVTRRPALWAVAAFALLAALAAPAIHIGRHISVSSTETLPRSSPVRTAYERADAAYGAGVISPVQLLVTRGDPRGVADTVARDPRVLGVTTEATQHGTLLTVPTRLAPYDKSAMSLVSDLRSAPQSAHYLVGGETASGIDFKHTMWGGLGLVLIALLPIVFVLFLFVFRSLVLPIKAVLLVIASLVSTLGSLLLLTNTHLGAHIVGQAGPEPVNPFVPLILVSIVVALSTDYEVVLIGRMREYVERGADTSEAVRDGLASTGRVITSAAAIMIVVFATFATAQVVPLHQSGLALAVAIFLDATLIRAVLVPATMRLLGRWNWWLPGRRELIPVDTQIWAAEDIYVGR